jgi:hypothetical protein
MPITTTGPTGASARGHLIASIPDRSSASQERQFGADHHQPNGCECERAPHRINTNWSWQFVAAQRRSGRLPAPVATEANLGELVAVSQARYRTGFPSSLANTSPDPSTEGRAGERASDLRRGGMLPSAPSARKRWLPGVVSAGRGRSLAAPAWPDGGVGSRRLLARWRSPGWTRSGITRLSLPGGVTVGTRVRIPVTREPGRVGSEPSRHSSGLSAATLPLTRLAGLAELLLPGSPSLLQVADLP